MLTALLRLLRDCAAAAQDAEQCDAIEHQRDLVLAQVSDELLDDDLAAVHDLAPSGAARARR